MSSTHILTNLEYKEFEQNTLWRTSNRTRNDRTKKNFFHVSEKQYISKQVFKKKIEALQSSPILCRTYLPELIKMKKT